MKRTIKILAIMILILAFYSFLPAVNLYLQKDPTPYTNEEAIGKLKAGKGELFGFVVLADIHAGLLLNDSAVLKSIRHMNREDRFRKLPIDFVAVSGDATFRGSEWDYRIYNRIRSAIRWPVISAMGNHDDDKGGLRRFKKYMGNDEFSFTDRNSYFIIVDNKKGELTEGQFLNIEEELKKSSSCKHRFIIAHKSPISPYQQSWYRPELSPWSYRFMKLCERYKVDIVFVGHEHMYKEMNFGGVKYIASGGGGMVTQIPRPDGGFLHYLVVRVYGDYVDYEVRRITPPFWEILFYYMWKDAFYFIKDLIF